MSAVKANVDTEEREYDTLDTFQNELRRAPPVPEVEYDYVYARPRTPFAASNAASNVTESYELTECDAYSVNDRH